MSKLKALYYIVPLENLSNILKKQKIFSRNEALKRNLIFQDPSNKSVQKLRTKKVVFKNYTLHDYVNLYINPRNAMLYCYLRDQEKVVVLEISSRLLEKFRFVKYSYKNAAASDAIISDSPNIILDNLDKIMSKKWNTSEELKKITQSEVLVFGYVPLDFVSSIIVPQKYYNEAKKIVKNSGISLPVFTKSKYIDDIFFERKSKNSKGVI